MMQVWVIDQNGYFTGESKIILEKELTNLMITLPYTFGYIKGKWNGTEWIEGATDEEIKAWQEKNKVIENTQVTEEQQLLSSLLLENANIKEQIKQQQELCSTLTLQIAELREEKANV